MAVVTVTLVDKATVRLGNLTEAVRKRVRVVIVQNTKILAELVRRKLSGQVLNVRSGKLLNSIRSEMVENQSAVYGRVFSTGVVYNRILEYGGVTRAHLIRPVKANMLRFIGRQGTAVFARSVNHPGSKIPEFAYMRSSLAEIAAKVEGELFRAGKGAW